MREEWKIDITEPAEEDLLSIEESKKQKIWTRFYQFLYPEKLDGRIARIKLSETIDLIISRDFSGRLIITFFKGAPICVLEVGERAIIFRELRDDKTIEILHVRPKKRS